MRLCDVNIFVYAHREDAPSHEFYRSWLESELGAPRAFLYCELVLSAFVRVVTHPRIFRPPSSAKRALGFAEQVRGASHGTGIMPGEHHWAIFERLVTRTKAAGNLIPDAYLAALAIEAQAEWVTSDADFKVFEPELRLRLLKP